MCAGSVERLQREKALSAAEGCSAAAAEKLETVYAATEAQSCRFYPGILEGTQTEAEILAALQSCLNTADCLEGVSGSAEVTHCLLSIQNNNESLLFFSML